MRMTVIPIVVGALGTVPKDLVKKLQQLEKSRPSLLENFGDRQKNLKESRRSEETCCHSGSRVTPPAKAGEKNVIIIMQCRKTTTIPVKMGVRAGSGKGQISTLTKYLVILSYLKYKKQHFVELTISLRKYYQCN